MNAAHAVLAVEDCAADVALLREALSEAAPAVTLTTVRSAPLAWDLLTESARPLPDLVLLDINLPITNGLDLLDPLRAHPRTACLPILVFSTSRADADVARAYALGARAYVAKPLLYADLRLVIATIVAHWLGVCRYPKAQGGAPASRQ